MLRPSHRHLTLFGPVTALQARTFAVWTLTSAVVRLYAAYNIQNKACVRPHLAQPREHLNLREPFFPLRIASVYDIALFTYLIAFGHFSSELLIFRTAGLNVGTLSPVIVSSAHPFLRAPPFSAD